MKSTSINIPRDLNASISKYSSNKNPYGRVLSQFALYGDLALDEFAHFEKFFKHLDVERAKGVPETAVQAEAFFLLASVCNRTPVDFWKNAIVKRFRIAAHDHARFKRIAKNTGDGLSQVISGRAFIGMELFRECHKVISTQFDEDGKPRYGLEITRMVKYFMQNVFDAADSTVKQEQIERAKKKVIQYESGRKEMMLNVPLQDCESGRGMSKTNPTQETTQRRFSLT